MDCETRLDRITRKRPSSPTREERCPGMLGPFVQVVTHLLTDFDGEGSDSMFSTLSHTVDEWAGPHVDVTDGQGDEFADAQPCGHGQGQHRLIAATDPRRRHRRCQQCKDFVVG